MNPFDLFKKNGNKKSNPTASKVDEESLLSFREFYSKCMVDFHEAALAQGYAERGLIFIPELMPIGGETISAFLNDSFFRSEFGNDPAMYYYLIMGLSLQAGIVFAAKWHFDFSELNSDYVKRIIKNGPADACKPYLKELGLTSNEKENAFYQIVYEKWTGLLDPYWSANNSREYTIRALLAAYQLGVSMILEKYGF